MHGTPTGIPIVTIRPRRGFAGAAAICGGISFGGLGVAWVAMILADRDLPGGGVGEVIGTGLAMWIGLPLLVVGVLGVVLGVVGFAGSIRRPSTCGGRGLAVAGLALGIASFVLLPPLNSVGHRLVIRSIDWANVVGLGAGLRMYADSHAGQLPSDKKALLATKIILPVQLRCPNHFHNDSRTCYVYIPSQSTSSDAGNVLVYGQLDCVSDHGVHVLFLDGRVEWVQPYARVLDLVEQTKARLAARASSSMPSAVREGDRE